jgi:D-aminopeptidase
MSNTENATSDEHAITEQLDQLFAPWNQSDAPGFVIGVALKGKVLYRRGFGMASMETAVANTPKTRMRIGSVSKHFTSLLALLLAEEGKLDIDSDIQTHFPELESSSAGPTLRQLMGHRGGLRDAVDLAFLGHGISHTPIGESLRVQFRQTGRNFAPGEAMIYSNSGYYLLSTVIERTGGKSFEDQLADRLFSPLGMSDTASIPSDLEITPGIATMHIPLGPGRWRRGLFPTEDVKGEGAIVSTVDDMLRWTEHLRARDRFGHADSWEALETPFAGDDAAAGAYALGLYVGRYRGMRVIAHSGGVFGGSSQMLTFPDIPLDVIIMANGAIGADPVELGNKVADLVLGSELETTPAAISAADHASYLGDWWSEETGMVYTFADEDGVLKLQICRSPPSMQMEQAPNGELVNHGLDTGELRFGPLDTDEPSKLRISFCGQPASYLKLPSSFQEIGAFMQAACGYYYSHDLDASAGIGPNEGQLSLGLTDKFGVMGGPLTPLAENVAILSLPMGLSCALTFIREGEHVIGFHLNNPRTRHLEFRKRGADASSVG